MGISDNLFDVYTSSEASKLWGLSPNTVTQWCNRGKFRADEARKSESTWIVTKSGMERLKGKRILNREMSVMEYRVIRLSNGRFFSSFGENGFMKHTANALEAQRFTAKELSNITNELDERNEKYEVMVLTHSYSLREL